MSTGETSARRASDPKVSFASGAPRWGTGPLGQHVDRPVPLARRELLPLRARVLARHWAARNVGDPSRGAGASSLDGSRERVGRPRMPPPSMPRQTLTHVRGVPPYFPNRRSKRERGPDSSRTVSRHVHRASCGTSPRTCSTWRPQPANDGLPHEEHFTRWHIGHLARSSLSRRKGFVHERSFLSPAGTRTLFARRGSHGERQR